MFLLSPHHSFHNRSDAIQEEELADANDFCSAEYWSQCIRMECSHETERANDAQRAGYPDGNAVFGEGVAERLVG